MQFSPEQDKRPTSSPAITQQGKAKTPVQAEIAMLDRSTQTAMISRRPQGRKTR